MQDEKSNFSINNLGLAPEWAARDREGRKLPAAHDDSSPEDAFEDAGMHEVAQAGGAEGMLSERDCQAVMRTCTSICMHIQPLTMAINCSHALVMRSVGSQPAFCLEQGWRLRSRRTVSFAPT